MAKITQQDLNKSLNIWPMKTYVGQAQFQLLYLGHLARLPPDRPERMALFGWLVVERNFQKGKRGTRTRRQLWTRMLELLDIAQIPRAEAHLKWEELAQRNGGTVWKQLVKKWCRQQLVSSYQDTWLERHKDISQRRRTEAAEERIWNELGAKAVGGGKYACPHCVSLPVMQFPKSLRAHILVCQTLPLEVRTRQAEQRKTYTGKNIMNSLKQVVHRQVQEQSLLPLKLLFQVC